MGVRSLSTFIKENSSLKEGKTFTRIGEGQVSESEVLVVDAWSFLFHVAVESQLPHIYGGEYDQLVGIVVRVCRAWIAVGLVPTFVFDGPFHEKKIPVAQRRIQTQRVEASELFFRTSVAGRCSVGFHALVAGLPPLAMPACVDALLSMRDEGVECFFADGEADPECAGLAAHYNGYVLANDSDYMIFNAAHKGYIPLDSLVWVESGMSVPDEQPEPEGDGFETVSYAKKRVRSTPGITSSAIPPEEFSSLTVSIYRPQSLAKFLEITPGLLPLLASLVGNDFTPSHLPKLFFPHNVGGSARIRRVATAIRECLRPSKVPRKQKLLGNNASPIDKVTQLIKAVVTYLSIRHLSEPEEREVVETIRETIFHYIVPDDFPGPGPLAILDDLGIYPAGKEQAKVQRRFLKAFRRGDLNGRLMGHYSTGTSWPRLFLEDPDIKASQEVVGAPLRQWIYAILANGLDGVGRAEQVGKAGGSEDELVGVEEESSDEENHNGHLDASVDADDAASSPTDTKGESEISFDPLVALRNQLESLRARGHLHTGVSGCALKGSQCAKAEATLPPEPPEMSNLRSDEPRFVTEYIRRGGKLTPVKVPVRELIDLIAESEPEDSSITSSNACLLPLVKSSFPIQLHTSETRLAVLLRALHADTPSILVLPPHLILIAGILRWTVVATATRLPATTTLTRDSGTGKASHQYHGKWRKEEAKALVASLRSPMQHTSSSVTFEYPLGSQTVLMTPSDLSTRAIQLTALVLAGIDTAMELAQALLLKEEVVSVRSIPRYFSGRRFHWYLMQLSSSPVGVASNGSAGSFEFADGSISDEELGQKEALWNAIMDSDFRSDAYWAEDSLKGHKRVGRKNKSSSAASTSRLNTFNTNGKSARQSMFDVLATLGDE